MKFLSETRPDYSDNLSSKIKIPQSPSRSVSQYQSFLSLSNCSGFVKASLSLIFQFQSQFSLLSNSHRRSWQIHLWAPPLRYWSPSCHPKQSLTTSNFDAAFFTYWVPHDLELLGNILLWWFVRPQIKQDLACPIFGWGQFLRTCPSSPQLAHKWVFSSGDSLTDSALLPRTCCTRVRDSQELYVPRLNKYCNRLFSSPLVLLRLYI